MKKVYYNSKQLAFLQAYQKTKCWIGGRGTGKSVNIAGSTALKFKRLPRAKIFFSSTTYNQILTKTLPPVEGKWHDMGFKEHMGPDQPGHYVIGVKPPANWVKPYSPPRNFKNVITFYNGFTIEMLSLDRPDLARGGSYDGGEIDEAALIKKEHYTRVLLPSIRGNTHRYSSYLHHNVNFYTSMPWRQEGMWLLEYEDRSKLNPEEYFYQESTAWDNVLILTEKGIERYREEMDYLEYMVEIENFRISKTDKGFYPKWDDNIHLYLPAYHYSEGERGIKVAGVQDRDKGKLLDVSLDFSGWFNCATIYQEKNFVETMIGSFHVKDEEKIAELVDHIVRAYADHKNKYVRLWGEPRGNDRRPEGDPLFQVIRARFIHHGWSCDIRASVRAGSHESRYMLINDILSETNPRLPKLRVNQEACKSVAIAVKLTEIKADFKKNKAKERDRKYPQEHAPHYTDTIDYFFEQKYGYLVHEDHGVSPNFAIFS